MITIIPIVDVTLDIIEVLNNGIRPEIELFKERFFVYRGKEGAPSIINLEEVEDLSRTSETWAVISMMSSEFMSSD